MSNNPFTDLQPRLTALTEGMSGSSIRTQQALVTFLYSAAQAQFAFSGGIVEDITDAFKTTPGANPVSAAQILVTRWHDRSEQAIDEFRRLSDELRNSLYQATAEPLARSNAVATEAGAKISEAARAATQTVAPKGR
ncbi:MAG: hypothetical protein PHI71_03395 [Acidiphilium sp.]|nr:hypothetical protein [Acidiphilium sp.]